jgi:hypothetical protein
MGLFLHFSLYIHIVSNILTQFKGILYTEISFIYSSSEMSYYLKNMYEWTTVTEEFHSWKTILYMFLHSELHRVSGK